MTTITIPKKLEKEKELVVIPRRTYEEFVSLQKFVERKKAEERDTDEAIRIYKKEKKQGKLKVLKSFADLK